MTVEPKEVSSKKTPREQDGGEDAITSTELNEAGGQDDVEEAGPDTPRMPETDPDIRDDFSREVIAMDVPTEPRLSSAAIHPLADDVETTVSMGGDVFDQFPLRDVLHGPQDPHAHGAPTNRPEGTETSREHLKGLLEALVFASDLPLKAAELAKLASAPVKEVKLLLTILKSDYAPRGIQLDEMAGGWLFRTHPIYAPFVRDMTKQRPVKLSRAQIETLAILAYRQPITRPEIDEIRGVDCGPVLKVLLDRDLIRILGKKDEPGRPILYGTTGTFLEFFSLKSLKDLPTLREFTELNEESRRVVEQELGDVLEAQQPQETLIPHIDLNRTAEIASAGDLSTTQETEAIRESDVPADDDDEDPAEQTSELGGEDEPAGDEDDVDVDEDGDEDDDDGEPASDEKAEEDAEDD